MNTISLGKLISVDLREVFASEPGDFTPWLAKEENLSLLSDAIGIPLQCEAQDKDVGPFRADILCKDPDTEDWVLIENQIERTDHTHLGQLLTYAAGLEAVTIVWIARKFTDQHRATLDWLNERTDEKINFFGLEIELWRIGDSPIAPKFNIISQPNDWSRAVREGAQGASAISDYKETQLRFWTAFKEFMEKNTEIKCPKPAARHWMSHPIGLSGAHFSSVISLWSSLDGKKEPEERVDLTLDGPKAKQRYAALEGKRGEIESALGFPVIWHSRPGTNMCCIRTRHNADFMREDEWSEQQQWLRKNLELYHKVFVPILQEIESEETEREPVQL